MPDIVFEKRQGMGLGMEVGMPLVGTEWLHLPGMMQGTMVHCMSCSKYWGIGDRRMCCRLVDRLIVPELVRA